PRNRGGAGMTHADPMLYLEWKTYATPWLFAVAAPMLLGLFWLFRRKAPAVRHTVPGALKGVAPSLRQRLRFVPWLLRVAAILLLSAAAARPQLRWGEMQTSTNGVAIQIVVDRSPSMAAAMPLGNRTDTNRLDVVKSVVRDFVLGDGEQFEGRPTDLIGLVAFALTPNTICPLVQDHEILVQLAEETRVAGRNSTENATAIGDALALAAARLKTAEERLERRRASQSLDATPEFTIRSKVIVLLTDGEQTRGELTPDQAAEMAAAWGIRIYAIGIGEPRQRGFFGRRAGSDMATLRRIAEATGGVAYSAGSADALREIYADIDRLETTDIESVEYTRIDELYPPLAYAGAAALAAQLALSALFFRRARA
ncbi:MAG: VWA domain-containing protein, partial [Planctomycetota bacterium]